MGRRSIISNMVPKKRTFRIRVGGINNWEEKIITRLKIKIIINELIRIKRRNKINTPISPFNLYPTRMSKVKIVATTLRIKDIMSFKKSRISKEVTVNPIIQNVEKINIKCLNKILIAQKFFRLLNPYTFQDTKFWIYVYI